MKWSPLVSIHHISIRGVLQQEAANLVRIAGSFVKHGHQHVQWRVAISISHVGVGLTVDQKRGHSGIKIYRGHVQGRPKQPTAAICINVHGQQTFCDHRMLFSNRDQQRRITLTVQSVTSGSSLCQSLRNADVTFEACHMQPGTPLGINTVLVESSRAELLEYINARHIRLALRCATVAEMHEPPDGFFPLIPFQDARQRRRCIPKPF
mmetsp:Transcript_43519/g.94814  ORF Transcript_43519/g.94814 Transcript_43519/m.94814 type:complete len:208 (-) Transcript_43519:613-1236(-)